MKKYFSLASALMLALGMGMTSCSNDLDEVQAPTEQQPEMHKLHLSASTPQAPQTRSYIEGVADKDAIKITGWKDGDIIWGVYYADDECGFLKFTFNGSTKVFDSEETSVTNDQIRWFVTGDFDVDNVINNMLSYYSVGFVLESTNPLMNIDLENNSSDIPMWGTASVVEGQLTTSMDLAGNMAFICLHNNSTESINVKMIAYYPFSSSSDNITGFKCRFSFESLFDELSFNLEQYENEGSPVAVDIESGDKVYLPVLKKTYTGCNLRVIINDNTTTPFAEKDANDFVPGKVYKLIYTGA